MQDFLIRIVLVLIVGFGAESAEWVSAAESAQQRLGPASATGNTGREQQREITRDKAQNQQKPSSTNDAPDLTDVKRQKLILLILLSLGQDRNALH